MQHPRLFLITGGANLEADLTAVLLDHERIRRFVQRFAVGTVLLDLGIGGLGLDRDRNLRSWPRHRHHRLRRTTQILDRHHAHRADQHCREKPYQHRRWLAPTRRLPRGSRQRHRARPRLRRRTGLQVRRGTWLRRRGRLPRSLRLTQRWTLRHRRLHDPRGHRTAWHHSVLLHLAGLHHPLHLPRLHHSRRHRVPLHHCLHLPRLHHSRRHRVPLHHCLHLPRLHHSRRHRVPLLHLLLRIHLPLLHLLRIHLPLLHLLRIHLPLLHLALLHLALLHLALLHLALLHLALLLPVRLAVLTGMTHRRLRHHALLPLLHHSALTSRAHHAALPRIHHARLHRPHHSRNRAARHHRRRHHHRPRSRQRHRPTCTRRRLSRHPSLVVRHRINQRQLHVVHRLKALFLLFAEAAHHDRFQLRRNVRIDRPGRVRLAGQVSNQHFTKTFAGKWHFARQQLVHHDPERVDISAVIDVAFAVALLWTHVRWRADHHAGARLLRHRPVLGGQLRDPKVEQLDVVAIVRPIDQKNVLWLEVAMYDPLAMTGGQRRAALRQDADALADGDSLATHASR